MKVSTLQCIVSGGQTGADRAALDWAMQHGISHAGWCPRGRKAEDNLPINTRYQLKETPSDDYAQRTEWNVRDSDGTVIFSIASHFSGGSALTQSFAQQYHKPYMHIHSVSSYPGSVLLAFLKQHNIRVLNVAGPRASTKSGISVFVTKVLDEAYLEENL